LVKEFSLRGNACGPHREGAFRHATAAIGSGITNRPIHPFRAE
jgi:hypothetical protein